MKYIILLIFVLINSVANVIVVFFYISGPCDCGSSPVVELNTVLSRLENITSRLEKTVTTPDKQTTAIRKICFS